MEFTEKTIESELIFDGRVVKLYKDTIELPTGKQSFREVVKHAGGVVILAVKDDKILLVKQFRYPFKEIMYELPAGKLEAGEDPKYIFRRLTRFAIEDVSMADPNAVTQAISCWQTYERLGSPEGDLALMQLTVYLATAPKSVGVYKAMYAARDMAKRTGSLMPPKNILNAPTKLMRDLGYNAGYEYDPDCEDGFSGANYFPDGIARAKLYHPVDRGFEREIKKRVDYFDRLRAEKQRAKKQQNNKEQES